MNKTLFLLPIAMMAMLTFATPAANANVAKVYKQTATVYQIKKMGKTYKITSQTKKTADRDLNISKIINVKGKSYYYSHVFKGYINDKAYGANVKLDAKRAKSDSSSSNTGKKENTNNSSSKNSNNTSNNAKIVNGYDETNQKIVDINAFTNALVNTSFNKLNEFRTSKGLQPLQLDNDLTQIAQVRAKTETELGWNSTENPHYAADGTPKAFQVADQLGFTNYQNGAYWGENNGLYDLKGLDHTIDIGNQSIQDDINEGPTGAHYQNDVNTKFTKVGIAFYVLNNNVGYDIELQ